MEMLSKTLGVLEKDKEFEQVFYRELLSALKSSDSTDPDFLESLAEFERSLIVA